LLPSALGSCDPLHVFFGGLGILLVGLLYLSQYRRTFGFARAAFVAFFVLLLFSGLVLARLFEYEGKMASLAGTGEEFPRLIQQEVFPGTHGVLYAPFGFRTKDTEEYPADWIDTGRYLGLINAPSLHDVEVKEAELAAHPDREVLIPGLNDKTCKFDQSSQQLWLTVEYGSPFLMPLRHSLNPYSVLCSFIQSRYHMVRPASARSYKYEVWARNP
jgi:hypothetical protein